MLELFSRIPDTIQEPYDWHIVPLPLNDEVSSLSTILLDSGYYTFIKDGVTMKDSTPFLAPEYIIPLKAKAFLDLSEKKNAGESIDSRDINKHRNDVFRLYQILTPDKSVILPGDLPSDMKRFIDMISGQNVVLSEFGIRRQSLSEVLENLKRIFNLI